MRGGAKRLILVATFVLFVFISIMNVESRRELGYPKQRLGEDRTNPYDPITPKCDPKNPQKCLPKQPANPYRRGCSKITRCQRDTG
ncbi:PREDICTED: protein RALF-like 3 [Camelina sativa]|uniref:Protein RALF-like 3 n=1 Tax=Camelina sativa TaxID=90675 RepID=A0ABM0YIT3_CAMSA|nr:PREDICTED: protein RALF-like 3 [Camelina sativa]